MLNLGTSTTFSILIFVCLSLMLLSSSTAFSENNSVHIEKIRYDKQGIIIQFNGKAPFQTVQVDKNQILIAVKGGSVLPSVQNDADKIKSIDSVSFDQLAGDVIALVFYTKEEVKSVSSTWLPDVNHLHVKLVSL